jgi:hypothetical protein
MTEHLQKKHCWENPRGKGGRPRKGAILTETDFCKVTTSPIFCQTFHRSNFFRFFQVTQPKPRSNATTLTALDEEAIERQPVGIQEQVEQQLAARLRNIDSAQRAALQAPRPYEVSSWLETTQWSKYLRGHDLSLAARLIDLPLRSSTSLSDRCLSIILVSFDRLIEQARDSIREDKINVFDQHRINSFLRRRTSDRPIVFKLKEGTYKTYKDVGKRLICFVYRLIHLRQPPLLHCALTPAQSTALDHMLQTAQVILKNEERQMYDYGSSWTNGGGLNCGEDKDKFQNPQVIQQALDRACLEFWIAVLDHQLLGKIYDSVLVGFLAVLGIDEENGRFYDAVRYTSHLSAMIKMAQMLVIQRAVVAAQSEEAEYPAQALEEMQDRFMVYGSRSPINWAQQLRTYGKKIRDSTTSLGFIIWSDDGQHLSYKDFELDMAQLKLFVSMQVELAQAQLQELLLIHADEAREDVVPSLSLHSLKDDPTISQNGWNFLQDPRNGQLQGKDRWLLSRVLQYAWLQERFFVRPGSAKWNTRAVEHYLKQVDAFLERLLLIVHITAGQPARGTELLSLQHCNTVHGLRRNIFIENGLVSFVTYYHKGYSVSGSVKIIHRYLPPEVSELVVYYLWLVLDFRIQLIILGLNRDEPASPFLWPGRGAGPWESSRLSNILKREFDLHLSTHANIVIWRHCAIAISRKHLKSGKFKKDYGAQPTPTWIDEQSAHGTLRAGLVYARGIEEAPGHVASARAEYRALSREWHAFLGFKVYSGANSHATSVASTSLKRTCSVLGERDANISRGVENGANYDNTKFDTGVNKRARWARQE